MGQIKNGVLGGFSGKVGSLIGYTVRGKSYIRGLNKRSTKKPSLAQLASRERFRIIQQWRVRYTMLFATTFKNHTQERSAQNAAHAFNSQIVIGDYPNYEIDPERIVISSGTLPELTDLSMEFDSEQLALTFNWKNANIKNDEERDALALLVQYDSELATFEASTTAALRFDKQMTYKLRLWKSYTTAHVYVTVLSDDRERAGNSRYMERIAFNVTG